jgi:hypothetical protein
VGGAELNALGFNASHAPMLLHLRRSGFRLQEEWLHRDGGPRGREAKAVLLALLYLDLLEFPDEDRTAAVAEPLVIKSLSPRSPSPTPLPDLDPAYLYALALALLQERRPGPRRADLRERGPHRGRQPARAGLPGLDPLLEDAGP